MASDGQERLNSVASRKVSFGREATDQTQPPPIQRNLEFHSLPKRRIEPGVSGNRSSQPQSCSWGGGRDSWSSGDKSQNLCNPLGWRVRRGCVPSRALHSVPNLSHTPQMRGSPTPPSRRAPSPHHFIPKALYLMRCSPNAMARLSRILSPRSPAPPPLAV